MRATAHEPLGVSIADVDLRQADRDTADELAALLAEHGVAVIPDQTLDDDEFADFLRLFGELVFTVGETPVPDHPDLNVISNVGRTTPPRSVFHVDTSYVSHPPAYTALRAVSVPAEGGQTLFSNQYRAYESLDEATKRRFENHTVRHVVTGVDPGDDQEHEAEHLLFRPHPVTGRVALYLSTPQRCVSISGLDDDESAKVITELYEHSTRPDNLFRHAWAPGDVVIWDNGCVMHCADHAGVVGDRVMHRGMSVGYASVGDSALASAP